MTARPSARGALACERPQFGRAGSSLRSRGPVRRTTHPPGARRPWSASPRADRRSSRRPRAKGVVGGSTRHRALLVPLIRWAAPPPRTTDDARSPANRNRDQPIPVSGELSGIPLWYHQRLAVTYPMQTMATRGNPNERLRRARGTRTQAELAELANNAIYRATGRVGFLSAKAISDLECGLYTWPAKQTRDALCAVLDVPDARDLGFAPRRRSRAAPSLPLAPMATAAGLGRPRTSRRSGPYPSRCKPPTAGSVADTFIQASPDTSGRRSSRHSPPSPPTMTATTCSPPLRRSPRSPDGCHTTAATTDAPTGTSPRPCGSPAPPTGPVSSVTSRRV